ncbi:MAG: hypothetical protein ACM33T_15160 [Solirubrobacterales bacterium]
MAAQDDVRENRIVDLFNLERPANRVRHGTDAILPIDDLVLDFELKSVTTKRGGLTTVRDFGPDHIRKWETKHWIVAFYQSDQLTHCKYGTPDDMAPWVREKWEYIRRDFEMAKVVPPLITMEAMLRVIGDKEVYSREDAKRLHKNQYGAQQYTEAMDVPNGYSRARMLEIFRDRARYVIERGSTLNNPHIPVAYFDPWPTITKNHAQELRTLIRTWLAQKVK